MPSRNFKYAVALLLLSRLPVLAQDAGCSALKRVLHGAPSFSVVRGPRSSDMVDLAIDQNVGTKTYESTVALFGSKNCRVTIDSTGNEFSCKWDYSDDSDEALQDQGQKFANLVGSCLALSSSPNKHSRDSKTSSSSYVDWDFTWSQESVNLTVTVSARVAVTTRTGKTRRSLSVTVKSDQ